MVEISKEAILNLAQELLVNDQRLEKMVEQLDNGDIHSVRIYLLGILDTRVEEEVYSYQIAESFYKRLGFTRTEMTHFRQYKASRDHMEGNGLPKKFS